MFPVARSRGARVVRSAFVLVPITLLSACPLQRTAKVKPAPAADLDLQGAARQLAADLAQQVGTGGGARTVVIDPLLDRATGQQTVRRRDFRKRWARRSRARSGA